jgi:hypothetical protein
MGRVDATSSNQPRGLAAHRTVHARCRVGPAAVRAVSRSSKRDPRASWWRRRESNPRPRITTLRASTCVFHGLVLALGAPVDGLSSRQPRKFLAGPPRGATRRPVRWCRLSAAADVPRRDGCMMNQAARAKLLACDAFPRGFYGMTRDPRHATRRQTKPVETSAPPNFGEESLAHTLRRSSRTVSIIRGPALDDPGGRSTQRRCHLRRIIARSISRLASCSFFVSRLS